MLVNKLLLEGLNWSAVQEASGTTKYKNVIRGEINRLGKKKFGLETMDDGEFERLLMLDKKMQAWKRKVQLELSILNTLPDIVQGDWLTGDSLKELAEEIKMKASSLKEIHDKREKLFKTNEAAILQFEKEELDIYNKSSALFLISKVTINWVPFNRKVELAKMDPNIPGIPEKIKEKQTEIVNEYKKFLIKQIKDGRLPDDHNPFLEKGG